MSQNKQNLNDAPMAGLILSPAIQGVLSSLLRAIVERRDELNDAAERPPYSSPACCPECSGTGYILVPFDDEDESFTELSDAEHGHDPEVVTATTNPPTTAPVTPAHTGASEQENIDASASDTIAALISAFVASRGLGASPAVPSTVGPPAPTVTQVQAAAASALLRTFSQSAVGQPAVQGQEEAGMSTTPKHNEATTSDSSNTPLAPQSTTVADPVLTPAVVSGVVSTGQSPLGWPEAIPPISTPIAGYNSLGPTVPPPTTDQANFAPLGTTRFYTVTRGIRVGVFGGWSSTSPYVTGVPAAAYIRHRTLQEALEEYNTAYAAGFVHYL